MDERIYEDEKGASITVRNEEQEEEASPTTS